MGEINHLLPDEYTFLSIREQLQTDIITLCMGYEVPEEMTDQLCECVVRHFNKLGNIL